MGVLIQLLGDILSDVITGQVESGSDRLTRKVWWRFAVYFIIVAAALWVAIASAFLWTSASHPGVVGLINFANAGGPGWMLAIPAVACAVVVAGSLPVAGRYGIVFVLQTALFILVLLGMAQFQGDGHSALNAAAISSLLVTLPAGLFSVTTALADDPPVTSPLAFLSMMYVGRVRHLRDLLKSAHRLGWQVTGPTGEQRAERAFSTGGSYHGRSVRVASGVVWRDVSALEQGYYFKVTLSSPGALPTFEITHKKIPPYVASRALTGKLGRGIRFYILPPYGQVIPADWAERFTQQIARGRRFLHPRRAGMQLASGGIVYTCFRAMSLPARSGDLEPLLDWMTGLASLLEEIAPAPEGATRSTNDDFAPQLPYGQLSDVDPLRRTW